MAGKPADPPQPPRHGDGAEGEHERGERAAEREGVVSIERLEKADGRALILYTVDGQRP